jgi:hypothetical protein
MSMGNSPATDGDPYGDRLRAKADADRAARLAGHKPLIERVLQRLRPHREEPGSDPQNFPRTPSDPAD